MTSKKVNVLECIGSASKTKEGLKTLLAQKMVEAMEKHKLEKEIGPLTQVQTQIDEARQNFMMKPSKGVSGGFDFYVGPKRVGTADIKPNGKFIVKAAGQKKIVVDKAAAKAWVQEIIKGDE